MCEKCGKLFQNRKSQLDIHVAEFCKADSTKAVLKNFMCPFCSKLHTYDRLRFHLNTFYRKTKDGVREPRKPHNRFDKSEHQKFLSALTKIGKNNPNEWKLYLKNNIVKNQK